MAQKISFKLEVFEGPMDLLLRLISKHQLNIYDIEITSLLEQYLRYMDQCREQDLELAGEFLEMAARLIYIKTASLLPRPEEAQKEKQALQGALIEYALCKQAAVSLQAAFVGDQIFVRRPMQLDGPVMYAHQHHPNELLQAYLAIGQKQIMQEPPANSCQSKCRFCNVKSCVHFAASAANRARLSGRCLSGCPGTFGTSCSVPCCFGIDQNGNHLYQ